jgi:hypothetical protein
MEAITFSGMTSGLPETIFPPIISASAKVIPQ